MFTYLNVSKPYCWYTRVLTLTLLYSICSDPYKPALRSIHFYGQLFQLSVCRW